MLLQDVMWIFPLLVPQTFVNQFLFIWGLDQCTKTLGQLIAGTYYYVKDLNCVYFACQGLPYGIED